MRVLVVYGTTEGQTRRIAGWIAGRARERGHDADLRDSASLPTGFSIEGYDAVIVAASVHQYRHQTSVVHFVNAHLPALQDRPTAFLSVSLAAAQQDGRDDARQCAERFLDETGWRPTRTEPVAGALLYTRYDFFKRQLMKLIVRSGGGPADASQDYEFTDWDALGGFVDSFLDSISS